MKRFIYLFVLSAGIFAVLGTASAVVLTTGLIPGADNAFDIGAATARFRNAWFSRNLLTEGKLSMGTANPNGSAVFDLTSTAKGFLGPRMTTAQRDALATSSAKGLMIYNTTADVYQYWNGTSWGDVGTGVWVASGTDIYNSNSGNVGIGTSTGLAAKLSLAPGANLLQSPQMPRYLGGIDASTHINWISVSGRYLYAARDSRSGSCSAASSTGCELLIYDIINPASPVFVGGGSTGTASDQSLTFVMASGRFLYTNGGFSASANCPSTLVDCTFAIWDISNPAAPVAIGGAAAGNNTHYHTITYGHYAYVDGNQQTTDGSTCSLSNPSYCKLKGYDISSPTNPRLVFATSTEGNDWPDDGNGGLAIYGKYLYLIGFGDAGTCSAAAKIGCEIQVYDLTNPAAPTYIGGADVASDRSANELYVQGRYLFVGSLGNSGTCSAANDNGCEVRIYDIASGTPVYVGGVDMGISGSGDSMAIRPYGRYVFADSQEVDSGTCSATTKTGCEVQIFEVSNPASPQYIGGIDMPGGGLRQIDLSGRYLYGAKANNAGTCDSTTSTGCEIVIYDVSGMDIVSANIHSLEADMLQARDSAAIGGDLSVYTGVNVGMGGIYSAGPLGVYATSAPSFIGGAVMIATTTTSTLARLIVGGQYYSVLKTITYSGGFTADWNNGNVQQVTLTGSGSATFSNPYSGAIYQLLVTQDGTGSQTVTWPAEVKWPGGAAPSLSKPANALDIFTFVSDGTNYYNIGFQPNVR